VRGTELGPNCSGVTAASASSAELIEDGGRTGTSAADGLLGGLVGGWVGGLAWRD